MKPLGIIQARVDSHRLPRKMLLEIHGHPLIWHAWKRAIVLGRENVVLACPERDFSVFQNLLPEAQVFSYRGAEDDVLGRFAACAHAYRTEPECELVRITPDDWPIDLHRERFTLAQLDKAHLTVSDPYLRQHIGYALFPGMTREINTQADYEAVQRLVACE